MLFSPDRLFEVLERLPEASRYLVAYSGGRDSHALLHALSRVRDRLAGTLEAIHIDHGLQPESRVWATHCEGVCRELRIPCHAVVVQIQPEKGKSTEAIARAARYQAIIARMQPGDMLMTAHHQDDQAETVLLQLLRGAGPAGLAAMSKFDAFGTGHRARPLLGFSREELAAYALAHRLKWIEDPSNRDTRFDRNYLRNEVMPAIAGRWPSLGRTLSRSARHCAEAQSLIDGMARIDLSGLLDDETGTLSVDGLRELPGPRARAVLRAWIRGRGFELPDTARLDRILGEMTGAARDRNPLVHWPGVEVRRYRQRLHLLQSRGLPAPDLEIDWDLHRPLELPAGLGMLRLEMQPACLPEGHDHIGKVRFRPQGERVKPAGRPGSQSFKNFFQQRAVPPWERGRIPLLYLDGELAAVADLCVCEPSNGGWVPGLMRLVWQRNPGPTGANQSRG
jgi:tRNA(Ile)-lysidine synthase